MPQALLKDYIAYARTRINPHLTDAAAVRLAAAYQDLRRDGRERRVVVATPRQLESLIRLSESLARLQLKEHVSHPIPPAPSPLPMQSSPVYIPVP